MQLRSPLYRWRHRARSAQEETGFLRIERPSIATAKDYYNHQCSHLLSGKYDDLGDLDGSRRVSKLRAIAVTGHLRRHSSPAQHTPIASPVVEYGGGVVGGAETGEKVLTGGKRKLYQPLLSASTSSTQIHTTQLPFNPTHECSHSSSTPSPHIPPTPLHLPITSTPPPRQAPSTRIQNPLHPQLLGYIPFEYTLRKLQDWGMVYLYNTATADVLVRGVSLCMLQRTGIMGRSQSSSRRSSGQEGAEALGGGIEIDGVGENGRVGILGGMKFEDGEVARISMSLEGTRLEHISDQTGTGDGAGIGDSVSVRTPTRRLPTPSNPIPIPGKGPRGESTRNEFFSPPLPPTSIGAMRNLNVRIRIIPPPPSSKVTHSNDSSNPLIIEKPFPIPTSLLPLHPAQHTHIPSTHFCPPPENAPAPAPALPLHIEYAIYRVPLLGAILLSGFVQKGDTVEVPVPWPEVWEETVLGIYLGGGLAGLGEGKVEKVRGNLEFLGCKDLRT